MAEPTDPAELAKVQAQDMYNAAAIAIEDLLDDFPNPTWDSTRMDTWLIDTVSHLMTCEQYWLLAGVTSKAWYKLEYSLIMRVPDLAMDLVAFAHTEFNELVERALDYDLDVVPLPARRSMSKHSKATVLPSHTRPTAATTNSRAVTPAPLPVPSKTTTPVPPPPKPMTSLPQKEKTPVPRKQQSTAPVTQKKVTLFDKPKAVNNSGPSDSTKAFQKDWTSPLHSKPAQQLKTVPSINDTRSGASSPTPSQALFVNAATRPNIVPGPDVTLQGEGTSAALLRGHEPLFLLGTDDELEQGQRDLVEAGHVDDKVAGTHGEDGNLRGQDDDVPSSDEATSPPPTNMARRLRQEPRISFVFDDSIGDLVEPHPTIFLSRPPVPPSQSQDLRRSTWLHASLANPTAAYLQAVHGSKSDASKKKKKDSKGKDQVSRTKAPRKRARTKDDAAQVKDKSSSKRPKLKETVVIDKDKPALATKVVRRRGPGLSKPPPVTLGVSGRGFGERVPSSATVVENGTKSIGVLVVDKDFGDFVEVDKGYWSKTVVPIPPLVTIAGALLPCKVNGVAVLNPIDHYRPKGSAAVNTFEGALSTIEVNNTAMTTITQQYLAGLNIITHTDSIRAQTFHLCGCLAPVEEEEKANDGEGEEDEAPDDIAEGESGPSKKQKHRSG
ncbi:hypothetical protein ARMGADRAFT_1090291 [Armillaria gallica]|uniref:Uncharacterized protein n=1 Tax=Armillaria gallica TaxID=47427 RepID=A0A2H3D086_ARMGA|nr:hypothetical protein ARMGADRAFT_1090291 [Armillaria gallica]